MDDNEYKRLRAFDDGREVFRARADRAESLLEKALSLDVYMTEGDHGKLDLADGSRCFDAGVEAYRAKLKTLLSQQDNKNG